ncbi:hypothetical protein PSTG_02837 [Puccinia striiformis f. sp. tritici PST-78]|uniref:CxC1-like cysteine cluster associated with KDZ transposases domain-containing protein n=1 Tax=Puccinia striiformis f. sp. tritici PST-78 TaxID=1165861 RepID=A0A0L0VXY5_9BASI|nr:hypothetical protein PSTG_02837 [Puccinia striiformis f. sp. tritici PST-78]
MPKCICSSTEKKTRIVDLVDIFGQYRKPFEFCKCTNDAARLIYHGYLAASPQIPQTAFSLPLLTFHNSLWNHCHARDLHKPFSAAVDFYREFSPLNRAQHVLDLARQTLTNTRTPQETFFAYAWMQISSTVTTPKLAMQTRTKIQIKSSKAHLTDVPNPSRQLMTNATNQHGRDVTTQDLWAAAAVTTLLYIWPTFTSLARSDLFHWRCFESSSWMSNQTAK